MILNILYVIATLLYFSSVIAYCYEIEDNCSCDVKWYFDYIKYFSITYIVLTVVLFLYVIMLFIDRSSTMIWRNTVMKYVILFTILVKTLGLIIYFYAFNRFQKMIGQDKKCGCYRDKLYDIINISTYIYMGLVSLSIILTISLKVMKHK